MPNPYLNFKEPNEADLVEDLVNEALNIHSEVFRYIPRNLRSLDGVLGEDRLSTFEDAYEFEAYFENINQFDGQGAFIARYGAMLDYTANLLVSRRHWKAKVGEYGDTIVPNRPNEGDLIYYPATDTLFEIKYVDDKNPFMQLGRSYFWRLNVELFQYSSEQFNTGDEDIDVFESLKTYDVNPNVSSFGAIESIEVLNGGKFIDKPELRIESENGKGAKLEPVLASDGTLVEIKVLDGGLGYNNDTVVDVVAEDGEIDATVKVNTKTDIDEVAERWASNDEFKEMAKEVMFDPENPFGD